MERIEKEGRVDEWCADNMSYFAFMFGKDNIVAAHLHRDEETPHIHLSLIHILPIDFEFMSNFDLEEYSFPQKATSTVIFQIPIQSGSNIYIVITPDNYFITFLIEFKKISFRFLTFNNKFGGSSFVDAL